MTNVFHDNFLRADGAAIAAALQSDGFFYMESALSDAWLARLQAEVDAHPFAINRNWAGGVFAESQYYLTHMLACSRAFYEYVTHPLLFALCDRVLGASYRVKAMRYYETYGHHHMQWHTDNKTDRGFAHIPGLIFIAYMADVTDGEFQYIRGSHNWSGEKAYSDYTDAFIDKNHAHDVVSFKGPKGSVIIYDTYGIHRAKPVFRKGFVRKSLFLQIDNKLDSAEPLLINPSLMNAGDTANAKLCTYLGFGMPSEYTIFPDTLMRSLPFHRLGVRGLARWLGYRMLRVLYNAAPQSFKNAVRRLMGKTAI